MLDERISTMPSEPFTKELPLPKAWKQSIKSAVIHTLSLAFKSITLTLSQLSENDHLPIRIAAELKRLKMENAQLKEMMAIKDARMARLDPKRRPYYSPTERIGAAGGQGMVLLDGIRLYSHDRQSITPVDPGAVGLQAHYEFEGNTNDSSGNARNGTEMDNPFFEAGKIGQAISFDGFNDYVEITGYKGILGSSAVTVTAWIRTSSAGTTNTGLDSTNAIVGWGPDVAGERFGFRVDAGRLRAEHAGGNIQGDTLVSDGGWHHVAVTVQENVTISYPDVILYLDGADDTRPTTDADPVFNITAGEDVSIGRRPASNDRFFLGQIDEVRIYNRALT